MKNCDLCFHKNHFAYELQKQKGVICHKAKYEVEMGFRKYSVCKFHRDWVNNGQEGYPRIPQDIKKGGK